MPAETNPRQIFISAGEASGDMYAARLAAELAQRTGAHLFGMGGERMAEAGVELVAHSSELPPASRAASARKQNPLRLFCRAAILGLASVARKTNRQAI
jgi:hypothetical protein